MINNFNLWCTKYILPIAYDESLSYYQQLILISDKLNEVIDSENTLTEQMKNLQDYINTNLEKYTNDKLTEWLDDGTLSNMLKSYIDSLFQPYEAKIDKQVSDIQKTVTTPFNFKGDVDSISALPSTGNQVNDTYYVKDVQYRMTWNGTGWFQSSLDESQYEDELSKFTNFISINSSYLTPKNLFNQNESLPNERLQANGNTYSTDEYFTSGFIDVSFVGSTKLWLGLTNYGINMFASCFYDEQKQMIENSFSSTVQNNINNLPNAKYFRFSAQSTYYGNANVFLNYGNERGVYTQYFTPYYSIYNDKLMQFTNQYNGLVVLGYSKNNQPLPVFSFKTQQTIVKVAQIISLVDSYNQIHTISTYNNEPQTFTITSNQSLVFNRESLVIEVVNTANIAGQTKYIVLIGNNNTGDPYYGQWFNILSWQRYGIEYRNNPLPYQPRSNFETKRNSYIGDQSMCEMPDYYVCFNDETTGGINLLNKNNLSLIKTIPHSLGHCFISSYDNNTDSILVTSENISYLITNATEKLSTLKNISRSDCIVFDVELGCFINSTSTIAYKQEENTTTLITYTISQTGQFNKDKEYTNSYRLGVGQDMKFNNGYLYLSCGYGAVNVYVIQLLQSTYKVIESYNLYSSTYEQEGIIVRDNDFLLSIREQEIISNKYAVVVKK